MNSEQLSNIHGLMHLPEIALLKKVIGTCSNNPVVIEIGTGAGTSLMATLEARPKAKIITMDILHSSAAGFLQEAGLGQADVTFVEGDSTLEAAKHQDLLVDVLILDGDHATEKVLMDLEAWMPLVRPGGILLAHDYGTDDGMWVYVKAGVDKFAQEHGLEFVEVARSLAYFRKGKRSNV